MSTEFQDSRGLQVYRVSSWECNELEAGLIDLNKQIAQMDCSEEHWSNDSNKSDKQTATY